MTNVWRRSAAMVAIAVAILWTAPAFAQGPGHWGRGGGDGWAMLRTVGLTDAQKTQIHQIFQNHRTQFRTLGGELRTAQGQLADKLYGAGAVTAAELAPLTPQIEQLRGQLAQERIQLALDVRNVLTPDQLAKLAQTRAQLKQLRQQERALLRPAP